MQAYSDSDYVAARYLVDFYFPNGVHVSFLIPQCVSAMKLLRMTIASASDIMTWRVCH